MSVDLAIKYRTQIHLPPGKQICSNCRNKVEKGKFDTDRVDIDLQNDNVEYQPPDIELPDEPHCSQITSDTLNSSINSMGLEMSPIKLKGIRRSDRTNYRKRKLSEISKGYKKKINSLLDLSDKELSDDNEEDVKICQHFKTIMEKLKDKITCPINNLSTTKKIQLLTIAPQHWSREQIVNYFGRDNITNYMVRKARELVKDKGIFSEPPPRKGKTFSQDIAEKIVQFFCDDRYSRMLPWQKDTVSVSKNVYQQKRLLLCTVRELHVEFKKQNPQDKVSISKFTTLRPKWCVSAGSSQTHSVCVCTIHQNVKLLLDSAHFQESYRELIKILLCSDERRDCLLLKCDQCPQKDSLKTFFFPNLKMKMTLLLLKNGFQLIVHN